MSAHCKADLLWPRVTLSIKGPNQIMEEDSVANVLRTQWRADPLDTCHSDPPVCRHTLISKPKGYISE